MGNGNDQVVIYWVDCAETIASMWVMHRFTILGTTYTQCAAETSMGGRRGGARLIITIYVLALRRISGL